MQDQADLVEIVLDDPNQKKARNQQIDNAFGIADSLTIAGIFIQFLSEAMRDFLETTSKYGFFTGAAAFSLVRAALAFRQSHLAKHQDDALVLKAAVEIVSSLAIAAAVVGALAWHATFALLAPVIFTAVLAAKTLFNLGSAIYYSGAAAFAKDPQEKKNARDKAIGNSIGFVLGTAVTIGVGMVMLAAKPILAIVGLVGSGLSTLYGVYQAFKSSGKTPPAGYKPLQNEEPAAVAQAAPSPKHEKTQGARLQQQLSAALSTTLASPVANAEFKSEVLKQDAATQTETLDSQPALVVSTQPSSLESKASAISMFKSSGTIAVNPPKATFQQTLSRSA